jgi:hypothetical protein
MICEIARSWIQSLSFLVNIRTGTKARSMVWTMVYNKMSRLKNAGDKSIGEVCLSSFLTYDWTTLVHNGEIC